MILRLLVHVEWHLGYGWTIAVHRMPRPGDRVVNAGEPGTLQRCPLCGDGFLHIPDEPRPGVVPTP